MVRICLFLQNIISLFLFCNQNDVLSKQSQYDLNSSFEVLAVTKEQNHWFRRTPLVGPSRESSWSFAHKLRTFQRFFFFQRFIGFFSLPRDDLCRTYFPEFPKKFCKKIHFLWMLGRMLSLFILCGERGVLTGMKAISDGEIMSASGRIQNYA